MRLRLPLPLLAAISLLAAACVTDDKEEAEAHDLVVRIVDSAGAPLGADTVYWSYKADGPALHKAAAAAHGTDTTTKAAARLNAAGTAWAIDHEGLHGAVYVRASYHKNEGAFCVDHGYKQLTVNADTLPKEVTLALPVARMCE